MKWILGHTYLTSTTTTASTSKNDNQKNAFTDQDHLQEVQGMQMV
tara:strand:- start:540 stop:674 length:135 start_codon:yes stop_codon:yes gene_type:complete